MDDELKGEGNSVNYRYRMHDPRVGRFFAVDPLTSKYPWYSPYQFSGNRPIDMIEFEGLEPTKPELFWNRLNKSEISKVFGQDLERTVVFKTIGLHKLENNKLKGDEMYVARTYSEAETNNYYYDKYQKEWIPFNNISCLSCDLETMGQQMLDASVKYGAPTLMVVSGVVAVAAAIPTGGGSLAGWGAVYGTASIIGGTYSVAAGTAILTLEFKGDSEAAKKVPATYYDATISIMFERAKKGENDKIIDIINGTISLTGNVMSLKLPQNSVQELDRAANIVKIAIDGVDYTNDMINIFQDMKNGDEK